MHEHGTGSVELDAIPPAALRTLVRGGIERHMNPSDLRVRRLEEDDALQEVVLSIYHALDFAFGGPALKIVENHLGRRKARVAQQVVVQAAPELPEAP